MPKSKPAAERCIVTVDDSKPKVEENGRKAIFLNTSRSKVKKVKVDGCLITGHSPRADYIVSKPGVVDVIVELKGKDIFHARDQIAATLPVWRQQPPFSSKIAGLIVCSRNPLSSSELQVMKASFRKQHRIPLFIDESRHGKEYSFDMFQ